MTPRSWGDEEDGHAALVAELAEDVEDLGLDGDVQGGGGLVGDEQLGVAGEGHGDHDALLLPAGHLVGVGVDPPLGIGDADLVEQLDGPLPGFFLADALVQDEGLHHLTADGEDRVERGHGLLEDHADLFAADAAHLGGGEPDEVLSEQRDIAADDLGGGGQQAHDREGGDALAGAALADDAQGASLFDREGDAVHGADHAFFGVEVGAEVVDF